MQHVCFVPLCGVVAVAWLNMHYHACAPFELLHRGLHLDTACVRRGARMTSTVAVPATERVAKRARLAPERVAPMPSGANLIEVDGKSCTHEVAWPPGACLQSGNHA
jgi:hypothetical protein